MCEYCEKEKGLIKSKNFSSSMQKDEDRTFIYIGYQGYEESDYDRFEIKFCPMCGNELIK